MADDPLMLVPLISVPSDFEAQIIAEALRAHGVPAEVFGIAARVGQWEFGINNDAKVMVRRSDMETAQNVLRGIKADSIDIDWDEIDVGAPDAQAPGERGVAASGTGRVLAVIGGVLLLVLIAIAMLAIR